MTRINVVSADELCDQHLLAEFRELTRIPNCLVSGRYKYHASKVPKEYCLGPGHVSFFYDKLEWLLDRYARLYLECKLRGFKVTPIFPVQACKDKLPHLWNDWTPHPHKHKFNCTLNNNRIAERMPANPRYSLYVEPTVHAYILMQADFDDMGLNIKDYFLYP